MQKTNIAIVGSVGIPAKYGGFETLTEFLTARLNKNFKLTVFCSAKSYTHKLEVYNNSDLVYIPLKANGLQSIPYDIWSLVKVNKYTKIVLVLGVSAGLFLPIYKLFFRKKIIVNVDGLEWKRQKWNGFAKWYLRTSEKTAVKYADIVIADNKMIQQHVKNSYQKESVLIPYGGDHVSSKKMSSELLKKYAFLASPYTFKVCRIEQENNIHTILKAFEKSKSQVVIIGNWDNSPYGKSLKKAYANFDHIHLLDPIYDLNILDQIRSNCSVYIHGHSAGGTNPSLVEAMCLELPVLAFDVNYNRETTNNKALYFKDAIDLRNMLKEIDVSIDIKSIGREMLKIAEEKYTWDAITQSYAETFYKLKE